MIMYLGCDPGADGAIVGLVCNFAENIVVDAMTHRLHKETTVNTLNWLRRLKTEYTDCYTVLEKILPGGIFGASKASFAKLYGSFRELRALFIAAGIHTEEVTAQVWLREFAIQPRKKGESTSHWKGRHKDAAQSLFNGREITKSACDSWLIAEYCRRLRNDLLTGGKDGCE